MTSVWRPPANPWEPPDLDIAELYALKQLHRGHASDIQQQLALKVIMVKFSCFADMTFRPGGEEGARSSTFAMGKAFVGQRIEEAINRPLPPQKDALDGRNTEEPADRRLERPSRPQEKPTRPERG
jgi:hypothetical protein